MRDWSREAGERLKSWFQLARVLITHILLLTLVAFGRPANASEWQNMQIFVLQNTDAVTVTLSDSVSGGCWPNPSATKAIVEKNLLQAGVKLRDANSAQVYFQISAVGLRDETKNGVDLGCSAYLEARAYYYQLAKLPNVSGEVYTRIDFFSLGGLSSGPNDLQTQLDRRAVSAADEFIVLWLKGRQ